MPKMNIFYAMLDPFGNLYGPMLWRLTHCPQVTKKIDRSPKIHSEYWTVISFFDTVEKTRERVSHESTTERNGETTRQ